jgi:hypothetical protein
MNARTRTGSDARPQDRGAAVFAWGAPPPKEETAMSRNFAAQLFGGALLMLTAGVQSAQALNPQPLPPFQMPRYAHHEVLVRGGRYLPPGPCRYAHAACGYRHVLMFNGPRYLNPQPLPPG